jgi:hypothetical protein
MALVSSSKFIKHEDLVNDVNPDEFEDKILTIKDVTQESFTQDNGKVEDKWVVSFEEEGYQPLVCNKTNLDMCIALLGRQNDNWPGKQITLYADLNIMFGTKQVGGVRVKAVSKKANGKKKKRANTASL